ncbi:MAG: sulfotransferase [Flavobacteriales bacterium]|nr:sulfotransferase [Flavobacteriales bacterium]
MDERITNDLGNISRRSVRNQRSEVLEERLAQLNRFLESAVSHRPRFMKIAYPPVFIVGCPRSGSTLLMQDLLRRGGVACPTNLMSRFYGDPWVGALAHRILFELDYRGEIFQDHAEVEPISDLGKTIGAHAPHEFWYWWRRYFHFEHDHGRVPEISRGMRDRFRADLAGMTSVFERSMLLKAMIMDWNIPMLHALVPEAVFIFLERDLEANASSLLNAREAFYGDRNEWWAFRPPEIDDLLRKESLEQVFAQVRLTNDAVRQGMRSLPPERSLHWRYERFCKAPGEHHQQLMELLGAAPGGANGAVAAYPISPPNWPSDVPTARIEELIDRYSLRDST